MLSFRRIATLLSRNPVKLLRKFSSSTPSTGTDYYDGTLPSTPFILDNSDKIKKVTLAGVKPDSSPENSLSTSTEKDKLSTDNVALDSTIVTRKRR